MPATRPPLFDKSKMGIHAPETGISIDINGYHINYQYQYKLSITNFQLSIIHSQYRYHYQYQLSISIINININYQYHLTISNLWSGGSGPALRVSIVPRASENWSKPIEGAMIYHDMVTRCATYGGFLN